MTLNPNNLGSTPSEYSRDFNFEDRKRCYVVRDDDPIKEGRIGVFIPELMTNYPPDTWQPITKEIILKPNIFANQTGGGGKVVTDIYLWARPETIVYKEKGGSYRIPTKGTSVYTVMENGDPNKLYWKITTPTIYGESINGKKVGSQHGTKKSKKNWQDEKLKPRIDVLREMEDNNCIIYTDTDSSSKIYVCDWNGNMHVIYNSESGVGQYMLTPKGNLVHLLDGHGVLAASEFGTSILITKGRNVYNAPLHIFTGRIEVASTLTAGGSIMSNNKIYDTNGNTPHHRHPITGGPYNTKGPFSLTGGVNSKFTSGNIEG